MLAMRAGGFPIVDVATVAKVHAAVMSPGKGPRRYIVSGTYFPVAEMIGLIGEVTGRRLRVATVPGWTLVPVAWLADAVQRVLPFRIPMDIQSFYLTVWDPHCDDSETTGELGITFPSVRDALVETIEWLARTGRLSAKEAGVLAA